MSESEPAPSLSRQAISAWDANASYWDSTIGKQGNKYWRRLQEPSLSRLLGPSLAKPGCRALDLATGNGLCARWLAQKGAQSVLATDASENMLAAARAHADADGEGRVRFRQVDVTSEADLRGFVQEEGEGRGRFDVVLMNMAIMDVDTLEPLAGALRGLLAEGGVFVATLLHPVFFTSGAARNIEVRFDPATGECEVIRSKVVKQYMRVPPAKGSALPGQPVKQFDFHRPMHELFSTFFRAGLVMDAMEELAFTEDDAEARIESTTNFTQLPAILAFRMRLP